MITLLNFGDTPFYFLFLIVSTIFFSTILVNIIAGAMILYLNKQTAKLKRLYASEKTA